MRLLFWQWRAEMWKLMARKRSYLGFGAFILLEMALYFFFHLKNVENWFRQNIQRQGESFDTYFSALTLAYMVLSLSVFILGAIFVTLVAGDIVAKETEDGNLRLILARPISRLRLLAIKYASCQVYAFGLVQFIAWSTLVLGMIMRGWGGGMFVFATPEQHIMAFYDAADGLTRYAWGSLFLSLSMTTASSIAFFLSCLRIKPAAATIAALSYLFIDSILRQFPFMVNYKYLLLTHYMGSWTMVYLDTIPWVTIIRHFAILAGVGLSLFVLGAMIFENRDVKS